MTEDIHTQKQTMRTEAKRARSLLSLDSDEYDVLAKNFFDNIDVNKKTVIAAYWPRGRELDTQTIIDECLERGATVGLPVVEKDTRIMKFAPYTHSTELIEGEFKINLPVINKKTKMLKPSIFIVPMLAFDRRGHRLGYGGGYYDATLTHYKKKKKGITIVGVAYAKQACLFNLPTEEHDIQMDWIITEQGAQSFT